MPSLKKTTFFIATFGCRLNQAESRMIGQSLVNTGFSPLKSYYQAQIVIINSCCVTKKASKEVRQIIRRVKRKNPDCFLVVAGCWVDKIKNQQLRRKNKDINNKVVKFIDLLINNKQKNKLKEILKEKINYLKIKPADKQSYNDKYSRSKKALVKVQDGCNNFCSYCIVPFLRGRSKSRPVKEVIKEIKQKTKEGIKEVILTGVDIADFKLKNKNKKTSNDLADLIKLICQQTKIKKISFGSVGLKIFNQDFLVLYRSTQSSRLTTHFHIPLQSGCNSTLARMGRGYKTEEFLKTIKVLKESIPQFRFSTDIIVGFAGETKTEFKQTITTIKKLKKILGETFVGAHVFRYSSRAGTLASKMIDKGEWKKVKEEEKKKRSKIIKQLV